jgi:nucleoside-diphosphate-sugar epimerase
MEAMVLGGEGLEGLVLRYGFFYGPGTYYGPGGSSTEDVRRRRMPVVGKGTGVFSFVHVDDAAHATVAAVERGAPGVYNVTDDDPRRVPAWLARLVAGRQAVEFALELRGASNERAKRELGWQPAHPSWRTGFAEALRH